MLRSQSTSLIASFLAVVGFASHAHADTKEVVANTGTYVPAPWQTMFTVQRFNQPFTRLDRVDWLVSASLSASAFCTNSTSFTQFVNINANVALEFKKPDGSFLSSFSIFASRSGTVSARSSSTISTTGSGERSGSFSGTDLGGYTGPGNVSFQSNCGTPSITVSGSASSNKSGSVFAASV